jgi:hypothetical protein
MRFQLPTSSPPLSSPSLMSDVGQYPSACSSDSYQGTYANFQAAARVAFRNCFQD